VDFSDKHLAVGGYFLGGIGHILRFVFKATLGEVIRYHSNIYFLEYLFQNKKAIFSNSLFCEKEFHISGIA